MREHISVDGDGPIPPGPIPILQWLNGDAVFEIERTTAPPQPFISYDDTIAILLAFSMKISREGSRHWSAVIILTEGHGQLGNAVLYHDI